mmetsp:Transcript_8416/g.20193  ORF Transcript_8416/g.20193 Transcript_8416/m.20193 type:complete len:357 (+) Transcript_8416:1585-2655(+)
MEERPGRRPRAPGWAEAQRIPNLLEHRGRQVPVPLGEAGRQAGAHFLRHLRRVDQQQGERLADDEVARGIDHHLEPAQALARRGQPDRDLHHAVEVPHHDRLGLEVAAVHSEQHLPAGCLVQPADEQRHGVRCRGDRAAGVDDGALRRRPAADKGSVPHPEGLAAEADDRLVRGPGRRRAALGRLDGAYDGSQGRVALGAVPHPEVDREVHAARADGALHHVGHQLHHRQQLVGHVRGERVRRGTHDLHPHVEVRPQGDAVDEPPVHARAEAIPVRAAAQRGLRFRRFAPRPGAFGRFCIPEGSLRCSIAEDAVVRGVREAAASLGEPRGQGACAVDIGRLHGCLADTAVGVPWRV